MEQHTRFMSRLALAAGLVAIPLASGTALAQTATTHPVTPQAMGRSMPAGNLSHATITKAGKALHEVMAINQSYKAKMSAATAPSTKNQILTAAKQKAMAAISAQGLTVSQYDQVLASAQNNPAVRQQLLSASGANANN
jgi:parvulin-like peptidyl-prolyl isomerase